MQSRLRRGIFSVMMLNERHILSQLLPGLAATESVAVGPGDDCAALRTSGGGPLLLAAVDQVIAGVHFLSEGTAPERAGAKLMKRNLSDIAAMGGTPRWALLAFAARGCSESWGLEFCRGAADAGMRYGTPLTGGDIAGLERDGVAASLTILGEVEESEIVLRRGAKPGDLLYVTGRIGNSFLSEHHLDFTPRLAEGRFLASHRFASAMLDISDGLLLDASRLAAASQVALTVEQERIPLRAGAVPESAWSDGEDYELLFTVPADAAAQLEAEWPPGFAPLTRIGSVSAGSGEVLDPEGNSLTEHRKSGYEH